MWDQVAHQKTALNIRVTFPRWNLLMRDKCLQSDDKVTCWVIGPTSLIAIYHFIAKAHMTS